MRGDSDSFSSDFIDDFFSANDDKRSIRSMDFSKRDIIESIFSGVIFDEFIIEGKNKEFNFGEIIKDFLSRTFSDIFNKVWKYFC